MVIMKFTRTPTVCVGNFIAHKTDRSKKTKNGLRGQTVFDLRRLLQ